MIVEGLGGGLPAERLARPAVEGGRNGGELIPEMSVTVRLEDDVDISRGDILADPASPPIAARTLEAHVCWMIDRPLTQGARLAM